MRRKETLGSGWLWLEQSAQQLEPDTLYLKMYSAAEYTLGIHVPTRVFHRPGELIAVLLRTSEKVALGEGILLPHKGGIRLVAPSDHRRSKLRVNVIVDIEDMIVLHFETRE